MAIPQAVEFRCGSHDSERHEVLSGDSPFPETLFCITHDDGERYARTGEEFVDDAGVLRAVFRYDADGSLTERADRAYSGRPAIDAP
jgi:hypothetical protein